MKLKRYGLLLALVFIPFANPGEGAASGWDMSQAWVPDLAKGIPFASVFPLTADLDLSDLDVRDAQNKPVSNLSAKSDLAHLFIENLFLLTAGSAPRAWLEVCAILESLSDLFHKAIFTPLAKKWKRLLDVLRPFSRRVVHNVDNLWISPIVGVSTCPAGPSSFSLERSSQRLHLRC